jgi:prolyl 4-hydroxylase
VIKAPNPDQAALARVGNAVRKRLGSDPYVQRIPTDKAEIYGVNRFLSPEECDRFITIIDKVAQPSSVFDPENQTQYRTSYSGNVERSDPFVRMIERRVDDLMGFPNEVGETVQGQRYQVGQEFQGHYDWFFTDQPYWLEQSRLGGQRSWTAMAFLNDVEEGGATEFSRIALQIPPQRGALLIWNNAMPDGSPNYETLHAGTPVIKGSKYIFTKWYRTRRWGY